MPRATKKKGGLRLEPIDAAFPVGDEDFWTMLPGDGESSLLVQHVVAARRRRGMPPRGDAVPADEIQGHPWINEGAFAQVLNTSSGWRPRPPMNADSILWASWNQPKPAGVD